MISVIVPIYNVAPYLDRCIQSICAQTYQNLEIILVNDGSTDASPAICEKYGEKDKRIQVIHKENGGLVSARQVGLTAANGAFICSVDGDDWIEPDYFWQMQLAQEESGADVITSGLFSDIGAVSQPLMDNIPTGTYSSRTLLPQLLSSGNFFEYGLQPHLVTKMVRKKILDKTQMKVDRRICGGEDAAVVYPSVLEAVKITVTDICCYHYVQHPESLTHTEKKNELECLKILIDYLTDVFVRKQAEEILLPQLKQYQKYMYSMRCMRFFEEGILFPYGGIKPGCKVVIYGAGVLGKQIYRYITDNGYAKVLLWLDRNAEYYQKIGMEVYFPEKLASLNGQFDYILIANTQETVAEEIRKYLLQRNVPATKIRWFSDEFICG